MMIFKAADNSVSSRLRYTTVQLLRVYGDSAYINGGLATGDRVCISPLQAVVDGMRVDVIPGDAKL